MTNLRLKYVHSFVDRHGHARHYFRQNGKRVALSGVPGSREFMDAYAACLAEQPVPGQRRPPAAEGTFAALAARYYGSPNYRALSVTSRKNYRWVIDRFLGEHGHRPVSQMRREHVDAIIGRMVDRPGAGQVLLKRLRMLVRYALELGWIDRDPTAGAQSYVSGEIHTWTEDELARFEERWPVGTKQRLGFALHLYTGQRVSDVCRMAWPDVIGDTIKVVQQKTREKLTIALHPELQSVLAATPKQHVAIIVTQYERPFAANGLGSFMAAAIDAAGLPEICVTHGLRKAAARRLAEAGCTSKEIAAVTGHRSLAEVERYTRAADQVRLNRQAILKQSGNREVATLGQSGNPIAKKAQK